MKKTKLAGLVLLAIGLLTTVLQVKKVINIRRELTQRQEQVALLEKRITAHQNQLDEFAVKQVKSDEEIDYLPRLETIANQLDLKLLNLAAKSRSSTEASQQRSIELKIEGRYQNLLQFLEQLKKAEWIIEVVDLEAKIVVDQLQMKLNFMFHTPVKEVG